MSQPTYFRIQQELVELIDRLTSVKLDSEEMYVEYLKLVRLASNINPKSMTDLNDIAVEIGWWLDDGDIRVKDPVYALRTTEALKLWAEKNRFLN